MRSLSTVFLVFAFLFVNKICAQIPNSGFEQWSNGNPDGWWTSNITTTNITQSTDAHSGSYAVRGDVINPGSGNIIPLLISGILAAHGFPVSERYANLTGYYKLGVITTENLSVVIAMFKNGQAIGVGGFQFFAASAYTLFTVPIFYSNGETPDSCQISITIGNNTGQVNVGAYFLVDDLAFQGVATDVTEANNQVPKTITLEQNYPNPFNPSTTIQFSIPEKSFVKLEIFNSLGDKISTLASEELNAGSYNYDWNAVNLPSGIYFYRLETQSFSESKKMLLLK
jgi:hypothetical protein